MNVYVIVLAVLVLKGIGIYVGNYDIGGSLTKDATERLKGLCAVLIMMHHISQHGQYMFPFNLFSRIGCLVVAIFFFLSGYGMSKSYSNDIIRFEKRFWPRIWNLAFPYLIMFAITVAELKWNGNIVSFNVIANGLRHGGVIGSWFFYIIILLYAIFHIIFCRLMNGKTAMGCLSLAVGIWIINAFLWYVGWYGWWYNASLAFAVGSIVAFGECEISAWLEKKHNYLITGIILASIYSGFRIVNVHFATDTSVFFISESLAPTVFAMLVMLLNIKFRIRNGVWNFVGNISYEIFLLHGIFINFLRGGAHIYVNDNALFTLLVILCSGTSAIMLKRVCSEPIKATSNFLI